MSFAQWKKSPEGVKAEKSLLSKNTKSYRSTESKLLHVLNNPQFWSDSRSERLPYIKAIYHAGLQRTSVTAYPSNTGRIPQKNWTEQPWTGDASPEQFILARAKKLGIRF